MPAIFIRYRITFFRLLIVTLISLLNSCQYNNETNSYIENEMQDTISVLLNQELHDSSRTIIEIKTHQLSYRYMKIDSTIIAHIRDSFTSLQLNIVLHINRIDYSKLYKTDTLVIPDSFYANMLAYSPFSDTIHLLRDVKKIALISYRSQSMALYENGTLSHWFPVSMGKKSTPTPLGLYHTNWKAKRTISTDNNAWILPWYFNLINKTGVSVHQYELPGYPASSSCIRMMEEHAQFIYYWAEQWKLSQDEKSIEAFGTPVLIYGTYDFDSSPPWYQLVDDARYLHEDSDTIKNHIKQHLDLILYRQEQLDSVIRFRAKMAS